MDNIASNIKLFYDMLLIFLKLFKNILKIYMQRIRSLKSYLHDFEIIK